MKSRPPTRVGWPACGPLWALASDMSAPTRAVLIFMMKECGFEWVLGVKKRRSYKRRSVDHYK